MTRLMDSFDIDALEPGDVAFRPVVDGRDRLLHELIGIFPRALFLIAGRARDCDDPDLAFLSGPQARHRFLERQRGSHVANHRR
jgi:hypothetical protein